jgi:uncharacterized protein
MVDCEGLPHPRALVGIYLLNQRKFFEAHEELEAAWKDEKGRIRELYQGILEAAVTYLHIQRGNYAGAMKVYGRSMRWLTGWQNTCRGIDVEQLRTDLQTVMAEVERLGESRMAEFDHDLLKPVIWKEGPDGR